MRDHVDVLRDLRRDRLPGLAQARTQQLEVDPHRIERVLDLVGHAGGEAAKRGQLLGVGQERLDRPCGLEVAQNEEASTGLAVRA